MILEYLAKHKDVEKDNLQITIDAISKETGMYGHGIAATLEMMDMVCFVRTHVII